ncbi:hypothetical protein CHUAL_001531, partial [Chamberlinius hualienensis]
IKAHNGISDNNAINCEFFEELDAILGTRDIAENTPFDSLDDNGSVNVYIDSVESIIDISQEEDNVSDGLDLVCAKYQQPITVLAT